MKKLLKFTGLFLIVLLFAAGSLLGYLTVDEYKPDGVEEIEITGEALAEISPGKESRMMIWNIGYGALGDNADFFMDGGRMVYSADEERVRENLRAISDKITEVNPDILFLEETDRSSSRSYFMDELQTIIDETDCAASKGQSTFAPNYKVAFVPLPIPPIGKVYAGLGTMSAYKLSSAERYALPCPFSWPLRTINLKRCLQVMRAPVSGSSKELVLINLHLEAYDEGEGKIAQTNMLKEIMLNEINKGNYVIAAGDFNQTFSNTDTSMYPCLEGMWESGIIDTGDFGSELDFYSDNTVPTCRSLDRVLIDAADKDPQHFQYYMLDGYIVSSNVEVKEVKTLDLGFKNSDHNPVVMRFELKAE
ncbi:MAG: endonuclease/exonuclease/phosphatase family protein [Butyrivibrio sp.]|nr:endonuclease/exonuclease/phosphatase family protein [Butyrivibrio sp.]